MVYKSVEELDFELSSQAPNPIPQKVLMTSPAHFDVKYVINPHMEGHIGTIDTDKAWKQWKALKQAYEAIDVDTHLLDGVEGYPDMVFCANQSLPFYAGSNESPGIILSNMHADQRKGEVKHIGEFFSRQGYTLHSVQTNNGSDFEGMGDAIWHPGHKLLWGGYGYRTDLNIYEKIAQLLDINVIALELSSADFYHLDTCFSVLTPQAVMIYPGAFTKQSLDLIYHVFEQVIACPEDESRELFACNAHCPDQKHVIIQRGCTETVRMLQEANFIPIEVDTSEFLKSGGSVFCMKQMFW